ncbi:unnamed protein product [Cuscuta campestris]|uniref:Uncharacterized protein n=1 Tax=Cuscuta campestris TaxID=132261 RepID=A0A484N0I0_9ASTE|nr:unnamed protein product [Cuscuta campestris]
MPHVVHPRISYIEDLIKDDDVDSLVALVELQLSEEKSLRIDCELDLAHVIRCVISHEAVRCATALFHGKTELVKDINVTTKSGYYPLHYAAQSLSPRMIKLFLEFGARPDVMCIDYGGKDVGLTPLVVALRTAVCNNKAVLDWSPSESIFKLIFLLCLPELQEPLEAIKLLAFKTEELHMTSMSLARCGKLLELAVLLMVAWEKLLNKANVDDIPPLEQCIRKELQWTVVEKTKLFCRMGCNEVLNAHKRREKLLLSAGLMLHLFNRVGGVLDKFRLSERTQPILRHVLAVEFADCMKAAGFKLEIKGTREDIRFLIKQPKMPARLTTEEKIKRLRQAPSLYKYPVFPHEPRPPPFSGTLLKPFHTCSLPCANQFAPLTFHPLRSLRDVPVGLKFLNTKGWNLFASSLKRGIRFALK